MTKHEKDILYGIAQHLENAMVRFDALERLLIVRGLIVDGERAQVESQFVQSARNDLALLRAAIAGAK